LTSRGIDHCAEPYPDPGAPENQKGTPLTLAVLVLAMAC
jgi:hypothetical protein